MYKELDSHIYNLMSKRMKFLIYKMAKSQSQTGVKVAVKIQFWHRQLNEIQY